MGKLLPKYEAEERYGPLPYSELGATVSKLRRMANGAGGTMEMDRMMRLAYAAAIEKAIRAKHRALHMRPTPSMTPNWYKPPSITRLLHYENPIPMAGDPPFTKCDWDDRAKVLYEAARRI